MELSVEEVEYAVGLPASAWKGNCHGVSLLILLAGLVPDARAAYGHWRGAVAETSIFAAATRAGVPFCNHGWLTVPDGTIVDATRWVFEDSSPYVWVGRDPLGLEYDEGGQRWREEARLEAPAYDPAEPFVDLLPELGSDAAGFVARELGTTGPVTLRQAAWLASQSTDWLGEHAAAIFWALEDLRLDALVPVDSRAAAGAVAP